MASVRALGGSRTRRRPGMLWTTASGCRSIVLRGLTADGPAIGAPPRPGGRRHFFGLGLRPIRLSRHQKLLAPGPGLGCDVLHDFDLFGRSEERRVGKE